LGKFPQQLTVLNGEIVKHDEDGNRQARYPGTNVPPCGVHDDVGLPPAVYNAGTGSNHWNGNESVAHVCDGHVVDFGSETGDVEMENEPRVEHVGEYHHGSWECENHRSGFPGEKELMKKGVFCPQ
jgi:hypothetical protein